MTDHYFALGLVFFAVFIGIMVFFSIVSSHASYLAQLDNTLVEEKDSLIRKRNFQTGVYLAACSLGVVLAICWCCEFPWFSYIVLSIPTIVISSCLPSYIRKIRTRRRNNEFEKGMLDFTVMILNSLKAGLSLPGSIEAALENANGPIFEEFSLVLKEHRLGIELQTAIQNVTKRVDSENLQLFALTISVCMRTGGSMVDVLDQVISTIRHRSEFYDKLKTMVAQSEFEAMLLSLSPLAAIGILYLVKPEFITPMFVDPIGWCALAFVIVWETIGFLIIKRIITVKY